MGWNKRCSLSGAYESPKKVITKSAYSFATLDSVKLCLKEAILRGLCKGAKCDAIEVGGVAGAIELDDNYYGIDFFGYFPEENPQYSIIIRINKYNLPAAGFITSKIFKEVVESMNNVKQ